MSNISIGILIFGFFATMIALNWPVKCVDCNKRFHGYHKCPKSGRTYLAK